MQYSTTRTRYPTIYTVRHTAPRWVVQHERDCATCGASKTTPAEGAVKTDTVAAGERDEFGSR